MYNHRITSFFVFTCMFWFVEMSFTAMVWACLAFVVSGKSTVTPKWEGDDDTTIKTEPEGEGTIKQEEEEELETPAIHDYPPATEADDEDDEDDDTPSHSLVGTGTVHISDSGVGTSLDSSAGRADLVRRRQKLSTEPTLSEQNQDGE
jgi:hypothetical protein